MTHIQALSSGISLPLACLQPLWPLQIDLPANMLISFSSFNLIVLGTESKSSDLPFCGLDAAQLLVIAPLLISASNLNQTIQAISPLLTLCLQSPLPGNPPLQGEHELFLPPLRSLFF